MLDNGSFLVLRGNLKLSAVRLNVAFNQCKFLVLRSYMIIHRDSLLNNFFFSFPPEALNLLSELLLLNFFLFLIFFYHLLNECKEITDFLFSHFVICFLLPFFSHSFEEILHIFLHFFKDTLLIVSPLSH